MKRGITQKRFRNHNHLGDMFLSPDSFPHFCLRLLGDETLRYHSLRDEKHDHSLIFYLKYLPALLKFEFSLGESCFRLLFSGSGTTRWCFGLQSLSR